MGKGGDLGGKKKKRRKERAGPVAANLDILESNKEVGGGANEVKLLTLRTGWKLRRFRRVQFFLCKH